MSTNVLFVLLAFLIFQANTFAQSAQPRTFIFEKRQGRHFAKIVFQSRYFDTSKHKLFIDKTNQTFIDGRPAFGTAEIATFELYLDGKAIRIPRRLYSDCYEPSDSPSSWKMAFAHNFRTVLVEMHGSDAAASYTVKWRFDRYGRKTRSANQDFAAGEAN